VTAAAAAQQCLQQRSRVVKMMSLKCAVGAKGLLFYLDVQDMRLHALLKFDG
jgi:hypothetical protein